MLYPEITLFLYLAEFWCVVSGRRGDPKGSCCSSDNPLLILCHKWSNHVIVRELSSLKQLTLPGASMGLDLSILSSTHSVQSETSFFTLTFFQYSQCKIGRDWSSLN